MCMSDVGIITWHTIMIPPCLKYVYRVYRGWERLFGIVITSVGPCLVMNTAMERMLSQ